MMANKPTNTMNTPTPRERFRKTLDISTGVSELLADSNASYISWLESELAAVTEQLGVFVFVILNEYKLALQSADNHNHEIATKLEIVTEQRDRLADLVRQFIYILDITEESDSGRLFHPTNITSCRAGDLQKAGQLVEALRRASRNQPTP